LNNFTNRLAPNNPPRSAMKVSDLQYGVAVDTYNQPTSQTWTNHQLTLYEALYIVQNYYPMAVWLDVKSATDLQTVATVIKVARQQMENKGPVANICLKLGWSTVKTVSGNPGAYTSLSNIYYFL